MLSPLNRIVFLTLAVVLSSHNSVAQKVLTDTLNVLSLKPDTLISEEADYSYYIIESPDEIYQSADTSFRQLEIPNLKIVGEWLDSETEEIGLLVIQVKEDGFWEEFHIEFNIPVSGIELHYDSVYAPNLIQLTYYYRTVFNRGEDQGVITEFWNLKSKERIAHLYQEHYHYGSFHDPENAITSALSVEYEAEIVFNQGLLTITEIRNFDGSFNYDTNQVETVLYKHDALTPETKYRLINNRFIKQ